MATEYDLWIKYTPAGQRTLDDSADKATPLNYSAGMQYSVSRRCGANETGGPCGTGDTCASDLNGVTAVDMRCQTGVCVVDCDNTATLQKGDGLCEAVNPALTCVDSAALPFCTVKCGAGNACAAGTSCLTSQGACLPTGSFLGSPCASGACSPSAVPMLACANNTCAARCNTGGGMGNGYCAALNAGLNTCQMVAAGLEVCIP